MWIFNRLNLRIIVFFLCVAFFNTNLNAGVTNSAITSRLGFEENKGQITGEDARLVKYQYKNSNLSVFLTSKGIAYQFYQYKNSMDGKKDTIHTYRMDVELIGIQPNLEIIPEENIEGCSNYYQRNVFGVLTYKKITYKNVYPNIDWVIYLDKENLKYDFVVRPNGNPHHIKLKTQWVENMELSRNGNLTLANRLGQITEVRPYSYQILGEEQKEIATKFSITDNIISFDLGSYNPSKTLTIDPLLGWSTYYGGSGIEQGGYTAVDTSGNVYLCGSTPATTGIASGGFQTTIGGNQDAFLVKFNSSGTRLWATYYGGSDNDYGTFCHVDKINNVYLCGKTLSTNSIASGGAHQTTQGGSYDGFLVKFNASGARQWATYYGGGNDEEHSTCATDTALNVYFAGTTQSNNNIYISPGFQNNFGGVKDAYLVKFNASGVRQWGSFYGGTAEDIGGQCIVDKSGNAYLCGSTQSTTNISGGGFSNNLLGPRDGFLVKFTPTCTRLWATYYGGSSHDYGNSVAVDTLQNVYLSGFTYSTSNVASGGFQNTFGGSNDAYLVKFNPSGSRLWGTYYGGSNGDYGPHCTTDKFNNVYLTGYTLSTNAIAFAGLQNTLAGNIEGFVAKFNASGTRYWGTYYGGTNDDYLNTSAPDGYGNVYFSGNTLSSGIASGGYQTTYGGSSDVMLVKMSEDPVPYIEIFKNKNDTICQGDTVIFTKNDINGGSNPKYRWFRNNVLVDTTTSYTAYNLATNDSIKCLMISNAPGLLYDSAWSFTHKFFVNSKSYTTLNITVCRPQTYFFKGQNRTATGTYLDSLKNSKGCDSFITLNLTVKDTSFSISYDTICSNQVRYFNGANRTTTGWYKDTLVNANTCDSFVYLFLFVKNTSSKTIDTTICQGKSILFNNILQTTAGSYLDTLVNANGCDSFITLNLTIKPISSKTIDTAICQGKSILFKGIPRTTAGTYRDTLINSVGCDSFITLNLTIKNNAYTIIDTAICQGFSYYFNGAFRNTSDTYLDTFASSNSCDSFVTLNLTIKSNTFYTLYDTICSNDSYLFNGNNLNTSGIYYDTLLNSNNCDSIITLNLWVKPTSNHTINHTTCKTNPYWFNGMPRSLTGIYYDTLTNALGCDSFITLNLTVNDTSHYSFTVNICIFDSFYFNDQYRKFSGFYRDTLTNYRGCDSFVFLTLVVNNNSFYNFNRTRCSNNPMFFKNQWLTASGVYRDTLTNSKGCDSFITLNYTLRDTSYYEYDVEICQGETYNFNGNIKNTTGKYYHTLMNSVGCDSLIVLNLTVRPVKYKYIDTSVCNGTSYFFKGQFYSLAGTYIDTLNTSYGCDSFVVLKLSLFPATYFTFYQKFCSNYPYYFNGKYLTQAGVYKDTIKNVKGCDSFITLHLYIDTTGVIKVYDTICSYDSILFNGKYYKTSGVYNGKFKAKTGCDSFVDLYLWVLPPQSLTVSKYNNLVLITGSNFLQYRWYLNDTLIPNEPRHYIAVYKTGNYYVWGTDSHLCSFKSNTFYYLSSSIEANTTTENINIFPIPAKDNLFIEVHHSSMLEAVDIYTTEGRKIEIPLEKISATLYRIQSNTIQAGTYIVHLIFSDGKVIYKPILKE